MILKTFHKFVWTARNVQITKYLGTKISWSIRKGKLGYEKRLSSHEQEGAMVGGVQAKMDCLRIPRKLSSVPS